MRTAIFPGSFDPFTIGHYDIVQRALPLFDEIVIGVGINAQKRPLFSPEERVEAIKKAFGFRIRKSICGGQQTTIRH